MHIILLLVLSWYITNYVMSPISRKCVFLLDPTVECLSFNVFIDVCAEFDSRRLFLCSSADSLHFLCAY